MREKQAPKRIEHRRSEIILPAIIILAVVVAVFFLLRNDQISKATADGRQPAEQTVIGVVLNGTAKAYPAGSIINDYLGGVPIVVVGSNVFDRRLNGRGLEFSEGMIDSNGRYWNMDGTSPYGNLTRIPADAVPWYLWLSWHRDTQIYNSR